jgi:hypothetical protein
MRHLVVGSMGEVGSAIATLLQQRYLVVGIDKGTYPGLGYFDVIHICIPYTPEFKEVVSSYLYWHLAPNGLVIIHSTVPVGTSTSFDAVHSPVLGPPTESDIFTFVKFFGGPHAARAAAIFKGLDIACIVTDKAANTEALKLWDTAYYGWNIVFEKAVKQYCDEHGLDFNLVYAQANHVYNMGYSLLGKHGVMRPVLQHVPGPIGGHCVIPNAELLGGEIADFILKKNKGYKEEKC